MNKNRNKLGRFSKALTEKDYEIIMKWYDSGVTDFNRLQGKIMLHFGLSQDAARRHLKNLLKDK